MTERELAKLRRARNLHYRRTRKRNQRAHTGWAQRYVDLKEEE